MERDPRPRRQTSRARVAVCCGALAFLAAGCRTYNQRTEDAYRDFQGGRFDRAMERYSEDDVTDSTFLAGAEAGTCALAAGEWEAAIDHFGRAAESIAAVEAEALVSPRSATDTLLTFGVSESFGDYNGEGFERVMLHASYALAFLGVGLIEDALVEVRLANAVLESEEKLYDVKYGAGGLGHFVSAVGYELIGRPDDAYIDYRRMEEKGLGGNLVGRSLVRLAREIGFASDAATWEERYGPEVPRSKDAARIIVIAGVGLGPVKEEATLDVATPDALFQWSVPRFTFYDQPVSAVDLYVGFGDRPIRTVIIEDVSRVAHENLEDRIAWLATKSAARATLKYVATDTLADSLEASDNEEFAGMVRFLGALFTLTTERADLRAWRTLPDTWQASRVFVDPGVHRVALSAVGGSSADLGEFELEPGETMFVLARTIGRDLYAYAVGGRPVAPPDSGVDPAAPEG